MSKTGKLSINSENMLPIIKKWLYSDHDIFVREQIANACDAITKLKKLEGVGEFRPEVSPEYQVHVIVNPDDKTLKFIDNGIGMTEEEVEKYITQIAFSGASEFLKKYEGKTDADQIIGHFGLGFYSAFMVADEVHIDTLSYLDGAKPVHWESDGESEYSIGEGTRREIGTEITLYLSDDCYEFCNEFKVREVLQKYCSFMPIPIYLEDVSESAKKREEEAEKRRIERNEKAAKEAAEKGEEAPEPEKAPEKKPINDTNPLWTRRASECKDEEYRDFYRKVFNDYKEPLFWIHLNTEFPFKLRGILYFPKINTEYDALESQIKLYNNQVFIADNIKEVIPEFLMTMKGVIDCPDLPLNVSRSALQNDGTVKKICDYISKKVADKLSGMCKTQREGKYLTLKEYVEANLPEAAKEENAEGEEQKADVVDSATGEPVTENEEDKEPEKHTVFYVTDEVQQAQYIGMFRKNGKDAVILKQNIDSPFITQLEQRNEKLKFARIDSEVAEEFVSGEEVSEEDAKSLTETFRKNLAKEKLNIKVQSMKDDDIAAIMTLAEQDRRMQDMMKMYGMGGDMSMFGAEQETLVLNANHPLVKYILKEKDSESTPVICRQLYDLAVLSHKPLTQDEMAAFVKRSNEIMLLLTK